MIDAGQRRYGIEVTQRFAFFHYKQTGYKIAVVGYFLYFGFECAKANAQVPLNGFIGEHIRIEACINASEHSFSPDRKIYQRFRVESDRLVITISSRGIVPPNLNGAKSGTEVKEASEERRGWGLKLIRTLMDEVEFERVDDGTSLRMTKYLRPQKGSANE